MKRKRILSSALALVLLLALAAGLSQAQGPELQGDVGIQQIPLGTAFTYQGRLILDSNPANGNYDFRFDLYDVGFGGAPLGTKLISIFGLTDGLFKVDLDFGSGIFTGDARFLEISVRPAGSTGDYTTLVPRQHLRPTPYALALPGLWTQPNATSPNVIGGYSGNSVTSGVVGATIGGGGQSSFINQVTANYATVGGGEGNIAGDTHDTVAGGHGNEASGDNSTVGGGVWNRAIALESTVSGGETNTASGSHSTVGGGSDNTGSGGAATIAGGDNNIATGELATVGGGQDNQAMADYATIAGGGRSDPSDPATGNRVTDNYGTVGGGGNNQVGDANDDPTDATYNTVGGGYGNIASGEYPTAMAERGFATVSGGRGNEASGIDAAIGGGKGNIASNESATVGGGVGNIASGFRATVGGGLWNTARDYIVTIAGGYGNIAGGEDGDGWLATVGGGYSNTASGHNSTIGGGFLNTASLTNTTVCGGRENEASGESATVPGGYDNTAAGEYSFAAGRQAKALHDGSFVWADSTGDVFTSTTENQFLVRANGGAVFTGDVVHGTMLEVTNLSTMYSYGVYGTGGSVGVVGVGEVGVSGDGYVGVSGQSVYTDGIGVRATSLNGVALYARSDSGNPIEAYGSDANDREFYVSNGGDVYADGTFNPGGADFAEMLPAVEGLEPGDVLVVGLDGQLTRSTQAYQPTVVGVYSTQPGFLGGAGEDADLSGKIPLAVVGVVPVKASAENGPIQPGDLLVASATPGHAMKAGPNPPIGTVLGKALEGLDEGSGVIQILVMLQ